MPWENNVHEVLILEPSRLRGAMLAQSARAALPGARVYCESEPAAAAVTLSERPVGLFVVAVSGRKLDTATLLRAWADCDVRRTRVLVVTPQAQSTALAALGSLPVTGIFDSSCGDLREFEFALRAVSRGVAYWSRGVREHRMRMLARNHALECIVLPLSFQFDGVRWRQSAPPRRRPTDFEPPRSRL